MKQIQLIIYGAGKQGHSYYEFFEKKGLLPCIYGFCDKNFQTIKMVGKKSVYSYEQVKQKGYPFLLALGTETHSVVKAMLGADNQKIYTLDEMADLIGENRIVFNRDFCAFFHIKGMQDWYQQAELASDTFWGPDSLFNRMFQMLDLSHVIELACGHGRHVPYYLKVAGTVTLVDILEENINFCKNRFHDYDNVRYYCNNGYNLEKLSSGTYSALFSYDAVVHFEMMDIFEYLKDIHRVLIPGGRALIHHSNNDSDYKASFAYAAHGRNFMSKKLFAYLAHRAGFDVLEQQVVDWGIKDLDCITLLQKPNLVPVKGV